jgi:hypothetical protein
MSPPPPTVVISASTIEVFRLTLQQVVDIQEFSFQQVMAWAESHPNAPLEVVLPAVVAAGAALFYAKVAAAAVAPAAAAPADEPQEDEE